MARAQTPTTAAVIVIGNEILSGRTRDANLPFLARELAGLGILLREARVVPDELDAIAEAVDACRRRYHHVFTTGGLGPTHDDVTAAAIARAFGRRLLRHPEAEARLRAFYPPERLNPARLKMADLPEGARLIDNPLSGAPGFSIENVHALAGIPAIAQAMFASLRHRLEGGAPLQSRTLRAWAPEGDLAQTLDALQRRWPDLQIGSYPTFQGERPAAHLVLRGTDPALLDRAARELASRLEELGVAVEEPHPPNPETAPS